MSSVVQQSLTAFIPIPVLIPITTLRVPIPVTITITMTMTINILITITITTQRNSRSSLIWKQVTKTITGYGKHDGIIALRREGEEWRGKHT